MALTDKQAVFVDEYLKCYNATQAAKAAGYAPRSASIIGWENLRKPEISEAISQRLNESAMSADEVLMRLAVHARGDMSDFWDIPEPDESGKVTGYPTINLSKAKAKASRSLIKKLKVKTTTRVIADIPETTTEIDLELYDAQAALEKIGKHHKLFTDQSEVKHSGAVQMDINDWRKQAEERRKQAGEIMQKFDD